MTNNDSDKGSENRQEQNHNSDGWPDWLPRWLFGLIGPLSLVVIIVGFVAAYYAYYFVTKDSVRAQFWVGFMFSFVALVVVMIQVVIYAQQAEFMRKQWSAMERQLVASERAHYVSERPYVIVSNVQVTNLPFEPDKLITYGATIENKGKTPAYNVEFRMYIDIESHLLAEEPEYHGVRTSDSRLTLGMNAPATGKQTDINDILTQEQVTQIADNNLFVYIWGIVRYREGFTTQTHYTKFYVIYDPEEKRCTAGGHHNDVT